MKFSEYVENSGETRAVWADRIGVSRPYLSDLLNGNAVPSLRIAVKIEQMTGGSVGASSWIQAKPDSKDVAA